MPKRISRVIKGSTPTMLEAEKANELIDAINEVMQSRGVDPILLRVDGAGRMTVEIPDFTAIEVTLCRNGEPVEGRILFADNTLDAGVPED